MKCIEVEQESISLINKKEDIGKGTYLLSAHLEESQEDPSIQDSDSTQNIFLQHCQIFLSNSNICKLRYRLEWKIKK